MLKFPTVGVALVEKPLEIQLAAVGGDGPASYALATDYEGLSIDASSGKATLDLPLLWKKYLEKVKQPPQGFGPDESLGQTLAWSKAGFERLMGEPLPAGKVAFTVPVDVVVSDPTQQQDRLDIERGRAGPGRSEVEKIVAARRAEIERRQEQARQEMQGQQALMRRAMLRRLQESAENVPDGAQGGPRGAGATA